MENSLNNPGEGEMESRKKQDAPFKHVDAHFQEQYVTRSVKVMIEFPLPKDSGRPDGKNEGPRSPDKADITGDKNMGFPAETAGRQENQLLFCGVVKNDHQEVLEGVAVMAFACYRGGIEKPLGYTFTDHEGAYIISIPEFFDYKDLDGFKVRAGMGSPPPEGIKQPANYGERPKEASPNKDFHYFLKLISNNRNKTIFDLMEK